MGWGQVLLYEEWVASILRVQTVTDEGVIKKKKNQHKTWQKYIFVKCEQKKSWKTFQNNKKKCIGKWWAGDTRWGVCKQFIID